MLTVNEALASEVRYNEPVDDGNQLYRPSVRYSSRKARKRQPLKELADISEKELLSSVGNAFQKRKKSQVELQPRVDTADESFWKNLGEMSLPNPSPSPVVTPPPNGNDNDSTTPSPTPKPGPSPTVGDPPIAPVTPAPIPTAGTDDSPAPSPVPTMVDTDVYAPITRATNSPTTNAPPPPTNPPTAEGNQAPPTQAPVSDEQRTLAPTRLTDLERPAESAASRSIVLGSSIGGALVLAGICFVFVVSCELRRGSP